MPQPATKLLLRNHQAPGDVLMLTAAVRDLHHAYPGRFRIAVETSCPELWLNNPHVVSPEALGVPDRVIDCQYPLIHQSNVRPYHFIHAFAQDLERKLGLVIPVREFRGDVYLSPEETRWPQVLAAAGNAEPYWIVVAGGKYDFTTKWWNPDWYQQVVNHFAGRVRLVQCGASGHWHPSLRGAIDLVGRTDLRQLLQVVYWAEGVLCPVTFAMHLAAAVPAPPGRLAPRPCVVIAGGREPPHWEMYPGHQFLHTIGALDCCATGGCWKSRCLPEADRIGADADVCERPVRVRDDLTIGRCMTMIPPQRVIDSIELYLSNRDRRASTPALERSDLPQPSSEGRSPVEIELRPRGVAVTIGTGRFQALAKLAAREVSAMTGLESMVLGEQHLSESGLELPAFLKFRLFELTGAENVFYFDADIVCLDRWDPRRHFGSPAVVAVRDRMVPPILQEATEWGVPPAEYFNAGMFIANARDHRPWLRRAEAIRLSRPSGLQDQSPLNAARVQLRLPLALLDRCYNWLGFGASTLSHDAPVIMAHKLAPDRLDLNAAFFQGTYELLAPRIRVEESEEGRLSGRRFRCLRDGEEQGGPLLLRGDGCVLPPGAVDGVEYWFVHEHRNRSTLALASEKEVLGQFVETSSGDWIGLDDTSTRLQDVTYANAPALTEDNARDIADGFLDKIPGISNRHFFGRGIVICAGGEKYLPGAWVCIRTLRHLGCRLPVELWHLRASELPASLVHAFERLGARCVNAAEVRRDHPVRFLGGWELKSYALLHSAFRQVLSLDADNVPVRDPSYLFDAEPFQGTGAIFWPDYGRLGPDRAIWRICRVPYRDEPEFESGQMLIDKLTCWRALHLAVHMNANSDFYYRHVHGDKDTFHLAWHMTETPYAMVPHPIQDLEATMCQHDFQGRRLFQHRNRAKWSLRGPQQRIAGFEHEELCRGFVEEFAALWPRDHRVP